MNGTILWSLWLSLVLSCAAGFTLPGRRRFVEWLTGLALNSDQRTITQCALDLDRPHDWKALETFAEAGRWDLPAVQQATARLLETAPGRLWHGFRVWAGDDTKVYRNSPHVWGTCTYHNYSARCPNRAATVRAHNWVILGAVLHQAEQPAWFLPVLGQLYCRRSQLPFLKGTGGEREPFRTKCRLLVEAMQQTAAAVPGPHLLVFDGGFAVASVVRPLVEPTAPHQTRIDFITRIRHDGRLHALPPTQRRPHQRGPMPRWGRRLAPPRQGGRWPGPWHIGRAFIYGRLRRVQWKENICLWRVLGPNTPVKAVVARVEGYRKRFTLVSSATALTGLQIVELFAARFRQEDGFRDLKQRLGWDDGRYWTKNPTLRTTQAVLLTMTLLRLLQFQLQASVGDAWWYRPPWYPQKQRPSILDVERLLRGQQAAIQQLLSAWLAEADINED